MRKLRPIAIAAFCSIGFGAFAADYPQLFAPPPLDPVDKPTELGSGWYLRGDASWGQTSLPPINGDARFVGAPRRTDNYSFGLGAGYKFNNWFRSDLTYDVGIYQTKNATTTTLADGVTNIICPRQLFQIYQNVATPTTPANTPLGYLWSEQAGTCSEKQKTSLRAMTILLNGYVDLGTWSGITPYIGAGAGVARFQSNSEVRFYSRVDDSLYSPTTATWGNISGTPPQWVNIQGNGLAPQPTVPNTNTPVAIVTPPNWNTNARNIKYNFAWALMAGVAIDVAPHAKLDIGYRYLNASDRTMQATSQEVRVGFRYTPD
jgi:opacity protein-like surface antigen